MCSEVLPLGGSLIPNLLFFVVELFGYDIISCLCVFLLFPMKIRRAQQWDWQHLDW